MENSSLPHALLAPESPVLIGLICVRILHLKDISIQAITCPPGTENKSLRNILFCLGLCLN